MAQFRLANDIVYKGLQLFAGKIVDDAVHNVASLQAFGARLVPVGTDANARATSLISRRTAKGQGTSLGDVDMLALTVNEGGGGAAIASGQRALESYGTVDYTGAADNQATWALALADAAAGNIKKLLLGAGTLLIQGGIAVPAGLMIEGCGSGATTLTTTTNQAVLPIGGDGVTIANLAIQGDFSGSKAAQVGIRNGQSGSGSSFQNLTIYNVRTTRLGGDGVQLLRGPAGLAGQTQVIGYEGFQNVGSGIVISEGYEFVRVVGCGFRSNLSWGAVIGSGNNNFVCCNSEFNTFGGVHLVAGSNDSHGSWTSGQIVHNTFDGVVADAIQNGFVFTAVNIQLNGDGVTHTLGISLTGSRGVWFVGCTLDCYSYNFDGSLGTEFTGGCRFPNTLANTVNDDLNAHPSQTFWDESCRLLDADSEMPSWVAARVEVHLTMANAPLTLTKQQSTCRRLVVDAGGAIATVQTITIDRPPVKGMRTVEVQNNNAHAVQVKFRSGGSTGLIYGSDNAAGGLPGSSARVGYDGTNAVAYAVSLTAVDQTGAATVTLGNKNDISTFFVKSATTLVHRASSTQLQDAAGSVDRLIVDSTGIKGALPYAGSSVDSRPYAVKQASVVFASDANHTLTAAEYECRQLVVTSTPNLTATRDAIAPLVAGAEFLVTNSTGGAQSIRVIGATGTGATVASGKTAIVYCDGTNWVAGPST